MRTAAESPRRSRAIALVHIGLAYILALPLYAVATAGHRVKELLRRGRRG